MNVFVIGVVQINILSSPQGFLPQGPVFKGQIMLSNRKIAIQGISINKTYCTIHQIEIYQVDSDIHSLNNWGQNLKCHGAMFHHWGHMLSEI